MTDQGGRAVPDIGSEASPQDVQDQWTPANGDEPDDIPARYSIPTEADEADAVEQLRPAPLDDDDRR